MQAYRHNVNQIHLCLQQCSTSDDLVMTEIRVSNRCPITQQVMRNPVRNRCCQHCYDREGVEELIRQRGNKAGWVTREGVEELIKQRGTKARWVTREGVEELIKQRDTEARWVTREGVEELIRQRDTEARWVTREGVEELIRQRGTKVRGVTGRMWRCLSDVQQGWVSNKGVWWGAYQTEGHRG